MRRELKELIEIHESAQAYLQKFKELHEKELKR
jgi:hypothetical protein